MAGPLGEMFDHGRWRPPFSAARLLISLLQDVMLSTQQ